MPKARGRRPAPNPKKRAQRPVLRPVGAGTAPARPIEAASDAVAAPLAPTRTLAQAAPAGRRVNVPQVQAQRFRERLADYSYVGTDLQRIGLLAGGLMVLLVALSFVVR